MPSKLSTIETRVRQLPLIETVADFWTSDELIGIIDRGIRDLWRDIVDLKQEHYLKVNNTDVYFAAQDTKLTGIPTDVHKVYLIEARDLTTTSANVGVQFLPLDYNHHNFQLARSRAAIDPSNDTFYWALADQGAPVGAPTVYVAPKSTSQVNISFCYCPTLGNLTADSTVPIPGEADNALIAWTAAFARAKEREDRSPDPNWLSVYATEKQHLLQSLGLREYQEPLYVDAVYQEYW